MKRAQAAIEFLTTYGWMFLIVIFAFGGLSYFGVLTPTNFVSVSCTLDQIACPNFVLYETDPQVAIELTVQNNFADPIVIENLTIGESESIGVCGAYAITDTSGTSLTRTQRSLSSGESMDIRFEYENGIAGCDTLNASLIDLTTRKRKYDLRMYLIKGRATLQSSVSGSLVTKAIDYS